MDRKCYVLPTALVCNASCWFCKSKTYGWENDVESMRLDAHFEENLSVLGRKSVCRIEITGGGEPFLNKRITDITKRLREFFKDGYIKVYTNGSVLHEIAVIDELNVSRMHWNSEINNRIMGFNSEVPSLRQTLEFFRNIGIPKLRLSIVMMRGGIEKPADLDEFIRRTEQLVDEYVVRPLFPGTPEREKYYCDFDFNDPRVQLDRGSCDCDGTALIWGADNVLYSGWSLKTRYTD